MKRLNKQINDLRAKIDLLIECLSKTKSRKVERNMKEIFNLAKIDENDSSLQQKLIKHPGSNSN